MRTTRTLYARLRAAEAALARAVAANEDPWRVAELRDRHAHLLDQALAVAADADVVASATVAWPPAPATPAEPLPVFNAAVPRRRD